MNARESGRKSGIPHSASAFALRASADSKPAVARAASEGGSLHAGYSFTRLSLSAFATTLTDDSAMAAAPITGESRMPNAG